MVVKVEVENFQLAPRHFGREPELGEGNIRFSLNRVPDCVDPAKLQTGDEQPDRQRPPGRRLLRLPAATPGPTASSPNGSAPTGSYSPATRPEIFYHNLPPGFYRLVVTLAQNNGATTPYHAVTNFQILPKPGPRPETVHERARSPAPRPPRNADSTLARTHVAPILHFV